MLTDIHHLYKISKKKVRYIIGLMSGTSLDGLDIALGRFEGSGTQTKVSVVAFDTVTYTEIFKNEIRQVFAKETIPFQHLVLLNEKIGSAHAEMVLSFLKKHKIKPAKIDLIASHGQTVYHAPKIQHGLTDYPNGTLQIGDGDHIAVKTGIITLSDFRQKHIAFGGEGAPLAAYGDYFLFSTPDENRIMLNLGGIANFTFLPASLHASEVFVTDTGPGNTLLDACVRFYFPEKYYDKDAEMASKGIINTDLLKALLQHAYFKNKSGTTGPEVFNLKFVEHAQEQSNTKNLSPENLLATLTAFSAQTIANSIISCQQSANNTTNLGRVLNPSKVYTQHATTDKIQPTTIYLSGGGMHNPLLVNSIKKLLPDFNFGTTDDLGINGDAKEAVLFATLANECVSGDKKIWMKNNADSSFFFPDISMGKISLPN